MLLSCFLAAISAISLVAVAALVFRRWGRDDTEPDGTTAGHAGALLSALFLLVFAIAIIVPWTDADTAKSNALAEAQAVTETYWIAATLPDHQSVRDRAADYLKYVTNTEWAQMRRTGSLGDAGWQKLDALRLELNALNLSDDAQRAARDDAVERLRDAYAARRQRATELDPALPSGVLFFTVLTGIVMLVFPFIAGARPKGMVLIPLLVMAALLGISVYLVFNVNDVFSGAFEVGPDAFRAAQAELARIP